MRGLPHLNPKLWQPLYLGTEGRADTKNLTFYSRKVMSDFTDYPEFKALNKALSCLYIAVPERVADDVNTKATAFFKTLVATPALPATVGATPLSDEVRQELNTLLDATRALSLSPRCLAEFGHMEQAAEQGHMFHINGDTNKLIVSIVKAATGANLRNVGLAMLGQLRDINGATRSLSSLEGSAALTAIIDRVARAMPASLAPGVKGGGLPFLRRRVHSALDDLRALARPLLVEEGWAGGWISVAERRPEFPENKDYVECIVLSGDDEVSTASYCRQRYAMTEKGRAPRWEKNHRIWWGRPITHWQPLPASPTTKKGQGDE